jgi:hypothetical protein
MTHRHTLASAALLACLGAGAPVAYAQFVPGNEAVQRGQDGRLQVDLPPLPAKAGAARAEPCRAADNCHAGAWLMVETRDGLRECTDAYARPGTCRVSTYGTQKLLRLWVVKSRGAWRQCQLPDLASRCVDMFARPPTNLPYPAVQ